MPVTVRGTDILFNDSTTQSTAATAGSLVTTANVLSATAGATAGAVGTYAFFTTTVNGTATDNFGATRAGSQLKPAGFAGFINGPNPFSAQQNATQSGTWRCMGYSSTYATCCGQRYGNTVWLRIA